MKVVIAGQGYVGLPLALRCVTAGHETVGFDIDEGRVLALRQGNTGVESASMHELNSALDSGLYHATSDESDIAGFDFALVTVPTPVHNGAPELTYLIRAAKTFARFLTRGCTVIVESTSFPGTVDEVVAPILESHSGLKAERDFFLGFSPERIDVGNSHWTLRNTPKLIAGTGPTSLRVIESFYADLVDETVPVSSIRIAEFAKLIENTYRFVNVGLANELADAAHDFGIDIWEALEAAGSKPFGFAKFYPGAGAGGHCLPVDPLYLDWSLTETTGRRLQFVEVAQRVNDGRARTIASRVESGLAARGRRIARSRVLLLGTAYKPNVADTRESPAVKVARAVAERGGQVFAADPLAYADSAELGEFTVVEPSPDMLRSMDAAVLLVAHEKFDYDSIGQHSHYVLDCVRRLPTGRRNIELL